VTSGNETVQSAPITGLSHVQLLVSDVGASAKWYSAVLGLVPFADDPTSGMSRCSTGAEGSSWC
jgi:catechol 2,3-dioxygenase-like lactoylglutathione lyase family enzyme